MVLGNQPPGRVGRGVIASCGGVGSDLASRGETNDEKRAD